MLSPNCLLFPFSGKLGNWAITWILCQAVSFLSTVVRLLFIFTLFSYNLTFALMSSTCSCYTLLWRFGSFSFNWFSLEKEIKTIRTFKKSNEIIYKQRYKYKRKWSQSVYPHAILWPCMLAKPTRSYERKVLSPFGNQLFSFLLA